MFERVASVPRAVPAVPSLRPKIRKHHHHEHNESLFEGSHGPTHHPHAWKWVRRFCRKAVNPLVRLADKGVSKLLHHDRFASSYVPTDIGKLHVLSTPGRGTLPPVVVLHGLSARADEYVPMLHKLKKVSRQVIAVDLPGHGKSVDFDRITAKQFLDAVTQGIDQLVSTPAIVMGHSLGAYTAAHYASARPTKVKGLVLLAPPGGPVSPKRRRDTVNLFTSSSFHDALYVTARAFPRNWLAWPVLGASMQERLTRRSLQALIHSDMDQMFLPADLLRGMKPPTIVFWADKERIIPQNTLPWLRQNLPRGSRFEMVGHIGHSEMGMFPKRVMRPFMDFVTRLK